jgi:UDP-N-acetylglucosamine 3-dehydrogenase
VKNSKSASQLRTAVIGVGSMGKNHARIYNELPESKLVAICDKDEPTGRKIAHLYKAKYYKGHKDLLKKEKIDALSVVVPTSVHKKIAMDVIEHNVNLLVEKPLANNSKDAKEISYFARKKNIHLHVGHIERYNPAISVLKSLLQKNKLGKICSITACRVGLFPPRIKDANVIIDLAVHDLDITCNLVNRMPYYLTATGGKSIKTNKEDHAEIFLDFGDFGCFIQVNWITPIKIRKLSLTGKGGYAELDYITQELNISYTNYEQIKIDKFEDFVIKYGKPKSEKVQVNKNEPLKLEIENFIGSITETQTPLITPEEATNSIVLAEAALESIKTGSKIKII